MNSVESDQSPGYRHIAHINKRAAHFGFLCMAVHPQTRREGFATYFICTMDPAGINNRRYGHFHASADSLDGPITLKCGILDTGYQYSMFDHTVRVHLEAFRSLVGDGTFPAMLKCMEGGYGNEPHESSVMIVEGNAKYFFEVDWRLRAVYWSLHNLYKFCEKSTQVFWCDHTNPVMLNLLSHLRNYIRL